MERFSIASYHSHSHWLGVWELLELTYDVHVAIATCSSRYCSAVRRERFVTRAFDQSQSMSIVVSSVS